MITYGKYSSARVFPFNKGDLQFTINLTENTTIGKTLKLPLIEDFPYDNYTVSGTPEYNFTVHWGDGNSGAVTSFNDSEATHVYSSTGQKTIRIYGLCTAFCVNAEDDYRRKYVSVDNFEAAIGLRELNFNTFNPYYQTPEYGIDSNLTSFTNTLNRVTTLESFKDGLKGWSGTAVPSGIFDNLINLANLRAAFLQVVNNTTRGVSVIPVGLLDDCTALYEASELFMDNYLITEVPDGFFDNNPHLWGTCGTFSRCQITEIPIGFFDNNAELENGVAFSNTPISEIPVGLFEHCPLLRSCDMGFQSCVNLTSLPNDLFINNPNMRNFTDCFNGCTGLTAIPSNLFDSQPDVATISQYSFARTFKGCTSLDGNAPTIWSKYSPANVSNKTECFTGSTGLDNYASIPAAWGGGGA